MGVRVLRGQRGEGGGNVAWVKWRGQNPVGFKIIFGVPYNSVKS